MGKWVTAKDMGQCGMTEMDGWSKTVGPKQNRFRRRIGKNYLEEKGKRGNERSARKMPLGKIGRSTGENGKIAATAMWRQRTEKLELEGKSQFYLMEIIWRRELASSE